MHIECEHLYRTCIQDHCNLVNCNGKEQDHTGCQFRNFCFLDKHFCNPGKDICTNSLKNKKFNVLIIYTPSSNIENSTLIYGRQITPIIEKSDDNIILSFKISDNVLQVDLNYIERPDSYSDYNFYVSETKSKEQMLEELINKMVNNNNDNIEECKKLICKYDRLNKIIQILAKNV